VDSVAPQIELVRPWRTATLVAATVAGVELVLLLAAGSVLLGRSLWPHVHSAAARAALETKHHTTPVRPVPQAPAVAKLPRAKTGILILNGNGVQGAAAEAATLVDARGYPVVATQNAPRTGYPTWRLMAAPGFAGEALRFAKDMDIPRARVGPLDGMTVKQLHGAKVVLLLGISR
jgi:LytR cell envelope-related transcriptional attenuator